MAYATALLTRNYLLQRRKGVILWGHLGLGDQISAATSFEIWAEKCERVILPSKQRNLKILTDFYAYIPNLEVVPLSSDSPDDESAEVRRISRRHRLPIVHAGRRLYNILSELFPTCGINRVLALALATNPQSLESRRAKTHLEHLVDRFEPLETFAFIDHHPGNPAREIPPKVIRDLEAQNVKVVSNDPRIPYLEIYGFMRHARELHLVASAPLCLALVTGIQSQRNICYSPDPARLIKNDYSTVWIEIGLPSMKELSDSAPGQAGLHFSKSLPFSRLVRLVSRFPASIKSA